MKGGKEREEEKTKGKRAEVNVRCSGWKRY